MRCLLVLMNPKRPREEWEIVRPGTIDGKTPSSDEMDSYSPEANWLPCSFNGLDEHAAERALGGFLYRLRYTADYLANNISFGELFRTKRDGLESAFDGLDTLARVQREHRFFRRVNAVELVWEAEQHQATVLSDRRKRIIRKDG